MAKEAVIGEKKRGTIESKRKPRTKVSIEGRHFLINGKLVYSELEGCPYQGIMMNARFIQGVFDDASNPSRFNRFGKVFDPTTNTKDLVEALPAWYDQGLRCITVGFQGGGPCFTTSNDTISNHPYKLVEDEVIIDQAYLDRMRQIIEGADALGMVVIVSCFYPGQVSHFDSAAQIINSLKAVCSFLLDTGYENILLEICNEYDLCKHHPIIGTDQGMSGLILMAKTYLGKAIPVGSSLCGGRMSEEVCQVSDMVLIHGNGCSPQDYQGLVQKVKKVAGVKPILCNEDSQCLSNMKVSMDLGVGWGYYNNMTKQEPPTDWTIMAGEDTFFAKRMAMALGIEPAMGTYRDQCHSDHYFLQGVGSQCHNGELFIRLASLFPETIERVEFYRNDRWFYTAYSEPYSVNHCSNWQQLGTPADDGDVFMAKVLLVTGEEIRKTEKFVLRA